MRSIIIVLLIMMAMGMIGCAGMHESIEAGSQPIGSVAAIPQSIGQGVTKGYVNTDTQSNPYNR